MKYCKLIYLIVLVYLNGYSYAQSYTEIQKVVASDRAKLDQFGKAVSIYGDYAVVATPLHPDSSIYPPKKGVGIVYIYELDSSNAWQEVQKIRHPDFATQDHFGRSVSLWSDLLAVGAPKQDLDDTSGNFKSQSGAVYLFARSDSGQWNLAQKIVPNDRRPGQNFGWDIAFKGKRLMVGAKTDNRDANRRNNLLAAGSAYFFGQDSSGRWVQTQKISASDRKVNARFGYSVDFSGNYAIVGAPWETADTVGSSLLSESGAVYFFHKNSSGTWQEVQKLTASDREAENEFGFAVAIDGYYALASAPYDRNSRFSTSSGSRNGTAYFLEKDSTGFWIEKKQVFPINVVNSDFDLFGLGLDLEHNRAVIGSLSDLNSNGNGGNLYSAGAITIYQRDSLDWIQLQKRVASDRAERDSFGVAVAMHRNTILVGAPQEDHGILGGNYIRETGSAYFFEANCVKNAATDVQFACDSFAWNNGQVFYSSDSSAMDTLLNYYGCDSTVSLQLTLGSNDSTVVQRGDTLTAQQIGASYQWLNCDSNFAAIPGANKQEFVASLNGNYAVEISNGFCSRVSDCIKLIVTSIEEQKTKAAFQIFPNPFKEKIQIRLDKEALFTTINVLNIQGQLIYTEEVISTNSSISTASWSKGVYFVHWSNAQSYGTQKLIKH